jgi:hypothetical protein
LSSWTIWKLRNDCLQWGFSKSCHCSGLSKR